MVGTRTEIASNLS
ncbi:hypothetical protein YPPY56_1135, partial [Yersinia pestis PY-56]